MKLIRVGIALLLASGAVACSKDTDGELLTPDPVAGLRYVNLVSDTGAVDFRVVDVVINAPNQVNATFRTGGAPSGVTTSLLPPHQPVLAGERRVRVFMNGTTAAVASQVLLDTTYTFEEGRKYTLYMIGRARAGAVRARIVPDTLASTFGNGKIAVRLLHLADSIAPNAEGLISAWVVPTAAAAPLSGTATFANRAYGDLTAYAVVDTSLTTGYKVAVTATGTNTPILFSANMPAGTRGTSTSCPIPGTYVVGTGITAVVVPRSVAGSAAASFTTPSVLFLIDQQPPRTCP